MVVKRGKGASKMFLSERFQDLPDLDLVDGKIVVGKRYTPHLYRSDGKYIITWKDTMSGYPYGLKKFVGETIGDAINKATLWCLNNGTY